MDVGGILSVSRRQRRGDSPQVRLARLRRQTRHRILRVCPTTRIRPTTRAAAAAAETAVGPAGRGRGRCLDGRRIAEIVASAVVPRCSATAPSVAPFVSVPAPPAPVRARLSVLCRGRAMETGERGVRGSVVVGWAGGGCGGREGWRGGRGARACLFSFRARAGVRLTSRLRALVQVPQHRSRGEECDAVKRGGRNPVALEHQLSLEVLERALGRPAPALLAGHGQISRFPVSALQPSDRLRSPPRASPTLAIELPQI